MRLLIRQGTPPQLLTFEQAVYLSCAFASAGPESKVQYIGSMYCSIFLQYSSSAGGVASATSGSRVGWISTCYIHIHCANGLSEFKEQTDHENKQFLSLHTFVECLVRKAASEHTIAPRGPVPFALPTDLRWPK